MSNTKLIDKWLVLEKISDDVFNGNHPNNVNVGSTVIRGFNNDDIIIGKPLILYSINGGRLSNTSTVVSFDEKNMILKTKNSTYKIHENSSI